MVKHFTAFTDLVLVCNPAHLPSWYTGGTVACSDVAGKPAKSITIKMLAAEVDNFLWCADDHYALKPFGEDLPNYYNKHARQVDAKIKKMITGCPNDWLNYICHAPMIISREKMLEACNWAAGREFPIKTLYANYNKLPGTLLTDLKFRGVNSYENIKAQLNNRPFFSTHENAMLPDMLRVLDELYPVPSPYEL